MAFINRVAIVGVIAGAMAAGCHERVETEPPYQPAKSDAPTQTGREAEAAVAQANDTPAAAPAPDVDGRSVEIDHAIIALCPGLEMRADAVVSLDPPERQRGEVVAQAETVQEHVEEALEAEGLDPEGSETEDQERWSALARCMSNGPLQNTVLSIVQFGPSATERPERAEALARELEQAGVDLDQVRVERVVEGLAANDPNPRLVLRIRERDV